MPAIMKEALRVAAEAAVAEGRTIEVPQVDNRLVLCMVRTHRKPSQQASLTVSACHRMTGDIVLGPFAHRSEKPTPENLTRFMQAHRWVMNKVHVGDGSPERPDSIIYGPPAISLMHRVELQCKACGKVSREWMDIVKRKSRDPEGQKTSGWSKMKIVSCPKCGCEPVDQRKLHCTAINRRDNSADDPVMSPATRDGVVAAMLSVWEQGAPADGEPTVALPRIWCVYDAADVPDKTWTPEDARARLISERAAAYQQSLPQRGIYVPQPRPLAVLPFGVARKYHMAPEPISKGLVTCWLDCDIVSIGWARMQDLYPSEDMGYKRQLWHDPKLRFETGNPLI